MPRLNIMCDGDTCAVASAPLRCYPYDTFTLHLCEPCFEQEAKRARTIARASTVPDLWPVHEWATAEAYKPNNGENHDNETQSHESRPEG
jgi:hypothetical protein